MPRPATRVVLLLGLPLLWSAPSLAATLHVPSPFATIQDAIDAASDGDTVLVASGEYEITSSIDFRGRGITLQSEEGPDLTVVRMFRAPWPSPASVVVFQSGETAASILEGFTLTGGTGTPVFFEEKSGGGGILCKGASPTIRRCRIIENSASNAGGGVLSLDGASPVYTDCEVTRNEAGLGGAVALVNASGTFRECSITENASLLGGGILLYIDAKGDFQHCTISLNRSETIGGGVATDANSTFHALGCVVTENSAESGGGIFAGEGPVTIENCLIAGNRAGYGGGVFCESGSFRVRLAHSTIVENVAYSSSGGGLFAMAASPSVVNSILWGNLGGSIFLDEQSTSDVQYSDIEGSAPWPAEGNIHGDPIFVEPGSWTGGETPDPGDDAWTPGDYRLDPGSPALDSATRAESLPDDLEGHGRPCGEGVDMGAYESGGCSREARFRRGDSNGDARTDISDAVFILRSLFIGGAGPGCADAADADDSGSVDLTDAVYLLNFLFRGRNPLPRPGTEACGADPTVDGLADCTLDPSSC